MSPTHDPYAGATDSQKEGYMPARKALKKSPAPFGLAIIVALAAGIAALVLWRSWDASPRDSGQMTTSEAGQASEAPAAATEETN